MKIRSTLSRVVAQQMGGLQGKLAVYASITLKDISEKLDQGCPSNRELTRILRTLDNIKNVLTKYQRQIQKYSSLINKLDVVIRSVNASITVLRFLPIPTAIAGVGVPIGLTNRYSQSLIELVEFLDSLNDDRTAIRTILSSTRIDTAGVEQMMVTIKSKIDNCIQSGDGTLISELTFTQQQSNNTKDDKTFYTAEDGRSYVIEVRTIIDGEYQIPKRIAEAKNKDGVVILKGEPSYTSDVSVLIEELIFRLENQLA